MAQLVGGHSDPLNTSTKLGRILAGSLSTTFGDFAIERQIGQGANGIVFAASQGTHQFAIKFLTQGTPQKIKRFADEYLCVQMLPPHARITRAIHFGVLRRGENSYPYIVMPMYGPTIQRPTPSGESHLHELVSQLMDGLEFLHANGVIHRDIKPQNIFYGPTGYVIGDLGIASFNPDFFARQAQTKQGERLGNYLFSAPEQAHGAAAAPTMDIYALGQIIQWYASGAVHKGTSREPLAEIVSGWAINRTVDACLRNNPLDRPSSIQQVRELLRAPTVPSPIDSGAKKWDALHVFDDALSKSFPKNRGTLVTRDQAQVNRLLSNLASITEVSKLWWCTNDGRSNPVPPVICLDSRRWLVDGYELEIEAIAVYRTDSVFSNFVVLYTDGSSPFGIHQPSAGRDSAGYWRGQYLTVEEAANGYADFNGTIEKLADPESEIRLRYLLPEAMLIAPHASSAFQRKSDAAVEKMLEAIISARGVFPTAQLEVWADTFVRNIDEEVSYLR
jgi:hypothetical protein